MSQYNSAPLVTPSDEKSSLSDRQFETLPHVAGLSEIKEVRASAGSLGSSLSSQRRPKKVEPCSRTAMAMPCSLSTMLPKPSCA